MNPYPPTIASKNIKCLRMQHTKEVNFFYLENFKQMNKEMEKDIRK